LFGITNLQLLQKVRKEVAITKIKKYQEESIKINEHLNNVDKKE